MSCTPNYPTVFPIDCVVSAIMILKSGNVKGSIVELTAAGYAILGFALGTVVGTPSVTKFAMAGPHDDHKAKIAELRDLLESGTPAICAADPSDLKGSQLTVFWHTILAPMLAKALEQLLAILK